MTRCLLLFDDYCCVFVGRPLWREVGSVSKVKVKGKVILRPTVSRPVRLGVRHPSGTRDQFFFLLEIFVRQLRVCYFVAPSLSRERVCNLLSLLDSPAQSRETQDRILCPNSLDSTNLEGQVPVFISPRNRVAQIYPQALGSLSVASYDSPGYGGGIVSRLHTGGSVSKSSQVKSSYFTTDGRSVSMSWCRA
jgi:hypothetical protein